MRKREWRKQHQVNPVRLELFNAWIKLVNERGWGRGYQEEVLKHFTGKTMLAEITTGELKIMIDQITGQGDREEGAAVS